MAADWAESGAASAVAVVSGGDATAAGNGVGEATAGCGNVAGGIGDAKIGGGGGNAMAGEAEATVGAGGGDTIVGGAEATLGVGGGFANATAGSAVEGGAVAGKDGASGVDDARAVASEENTGMTEDVASVAGGCSAVRAGAGGSGARRGGAGGVAANVMGDGMATIGGATKARMNHAAKTTKAATGTAAATIGTHRRVGRRSKSSVPSNSMATPDPRLAEEKPEKEHFSLIPT